MDEFSDHQNEDTLRQLRKAQQTLEQVEAKMKKFKNRKKQQNKQRVIKAPYPDLSQYFTFLSKQLQNDLLQPDASYSHMNEHRRIPSLSQSSKTDLPNDRNKENNSLSINQKLQKQKQSSINKIEQYYNQRNSLLDEKYLELKETKEKIIRDQKLLIRNNQQLQEQIDSRRRGKLQSNDLAELKRKIEKMRNKINDVELQNGKVIQRKKQLQKQIKQNIKTHKNYLSNQIGLMRPKSSSKCKYH